MTDSERLGQNEIEASEPHVIVGIGCRKFKAEAESQLIAAVDLVMSMPLREVQPTTSMATEGFLLKRDRNLSPAHDIVTIAKLPVEILLEIFDSYRQKFEFERQRNYDRDWNNKNGWFKLAHVCHKWRSIVLTFSTRLQLRLFFAAETPTRAAVLTALSSLPIIIDYRSRRFWNVALQNRLTSALSYPDRVYKIALTVTYTNRDMIPKALNFAFPKLESLELHGTRMPGFLLPPTFLMTSSKSLRRLRILGATLASSIPLLSTATALVDLTLSIDTVVLPQSGTSLLTLLQCLPCLRNLAVSAHAIHALSVPPKMGDIVTLSELSYLCFKGPTDIVEWLIPGLAIPSLQNIHISLIRGNATFHIPHLSNLIRNSRIIFVAAQMTLSQSAFTLSLLRHPYFTDDPPFNIVARTPSSIAEIGSELSEMLATVEDASCLLFPIPYPGMFPVNLAPWRGFFEHLQNVKMLRLQHDLEIQVADMLLQDDKQPTTNLFPSLEGIEVYMKNPDLPIPESEGLSRLGPFEAFVSARQQAGQPVKVYWNRDQVLPKSYHVRDWWFEY